MQFKNILVLEYVLLNYSILQNSRTHDAIVSYTAACLFTITLADC